MATVRDLCKKAKDSYVQGDYKAAFDTLHTAMEKDPDDYKVKMGLAFCLMRLGEYDLAIEIFDQLISTEHSNIKPIYQKGLCYLQLNKFQEAIDCFDMIIKDFKKDKRIYHKKGFCLYQLQRYSEALDCFEIAAKSDINAYFSAMYYGLCSFWLDNQGDGLLILKKLCEKYPIEKSEQYYVIHYETSLCLFVVGENEKAIAIYDELLKKDFEIKTVNYLKGLCLQYMKKYEEAIACFEIIEENDTDYEATKNCIAECKAELM